MDYKKAQKMLESAFPFNKFKRIETWVWFERNKAMIKKSPSKYNEESIQSLIQKGQSLYNAHVRHYQQYCNTCSAIISEGIKVFLFLKWPVPQEFSIYRKALNNDEYILVPRKEFKQLAISLKRGSGSQPIRILSTNRLEISGRQLLMVQAKRVLREKQMPISPEIQALMKTIDQYSSMSMHQHIKFIPFEDIKLQLNEAVGPLSEKKREEEIKKYQDMENKNRDDMLEEYQRVRNELRERLRNLDMASDEVIENILDDNMQDIEKDIRSKRIVGMVKQKEGLPPPEYTFEAVMESRMNELKTRLLVAKNGIAKEERNLQQNLKAAEAEAAKQAAKFPKYKRDFIDTLNIPANHPELRSEAIRLIQDYQNLPKPMTWEDIQKRVRDDIQKKISKLT